MGTHIENLKVGDYVVVVEDKRKPVLDPYGNQVTVDLTGTPYKIIAFALPFVAITDGRNRFSIDTREWGVQKVTRKYFLAIHGRRREPQPEQEQAGVATESDAPRCIRCGTRLVQTLETKDTKAKRNYWRYLCQQCGWKGDEVLA